MIGEAALYLAVPDDVRAALLVIAGRPLAFRVVMAALRAGIPRVAVPVALRHPALEAALARARSARGKVIWVDASSPAPRSSLLLLPAATVVTAATLRGLLAREPVVAVIAADGTDASFVTVPEVLGATLWTSIASAEPIGDAIARTVKGAALVAPAGPLARVRSAGNVGRAEGQLLATLGSPIDTRVDVAVHRRLSRPLTRAAVALGVPPNPITVLSLVVGVGAAACIAHGTLKGAVAGLLLYVAAVVLDHTDGEVARLTLAESTVGEWLDVAADTTVHALLVLALGIAAQRAAGAGGWLGVAAAGGVLAAAWLTKTSAAGHGVLGSLLASLGNRNGFYAMLLAAVAARALRPELLPSLMLLIAAGTNAYWVGHVVARLRARRSATAA